MNHDLLTILILSFLFLFIGGGFMYLDYSMTKKGKENREKRKKLSHNNISNSN